MEVRGFILGGEEVRREPYLEVVYPYNGKVVGKVSRATQEDAKRAVEIALEGFKENSSLSSYQRYEILKRACELLSQRKEEFARTIVLEVGKTIREARTEVLRAIQTLSFSAEEVRRVGGEVFPADAHPNGQGKFSFYVRAPVGVVVAITPFNFPLNLAMHKLAPALGVGNAVILKPSERTPLTALKLAQIFYEAGLPKKALSVLPGFADVGVALTTDPRVRVVSFTGSRKVGEIISRQVGIKKLILELGSNSALVLMEDGDLNKAVEKTVLGGYALAGQVCISVQRVFVHKSRFEEFLKRLKERVSKLKVGDPMEEETDLGPMIAPSEVRRVLDWIEEARKKGAKVEMGALACAEDESVLSPTILSLVPQDSKIFKEEVFAPVVLVNPFESLEEVIEKVNNTDYGLQVGVFTSNLKVAFEFIKRAEVGGVLINEAPTFRLDHQPYGGVKFSGVGREGPKFAIEDYTEIKSVVIDLS